VKERDFLSCIRKLIQFLMYVSVCCWLGSRKHYSLLHRGSINQLNISTTIYYVICTCICDRKKKMLLIYV